MEGHCNFPVLCWSTIHWAFKWAIPKSTFGWLGYSHDLGNLQRCFFPPMSHYYTSQYFLATGGYYQCRDRFKRSFKKRRSCRSTPTFLGVLPYHNEKGGMCWCDTETSGWMLTPKEAIHLSSLSAWINVWQMSPERWIVKWLTQNTRSCNKGLFLRG